MHFIIMKKKIEIVKNISYLGIHFSSSGKFNFAPDQRVNKARAAAAKLKIVIRNGLLFRQRCFI